MVVIEELPDSPNQPSSSHSQAEHDLGQFKQQQFTFGVGKGRLSVGQRSIRQAGSEETNIEYDNRGVTKWHTFSDSLRKFLRK